MAFEMAEAFVSVKPKLDEAALHETGQQVKKSAEGLGEETGDVITRGIGAAVLLNGARTVGPAVNQFFSDTFDQSATIQALTNKAGTVFGEEIGLVTDWASEAAHAMGLTEGQAVGLAAGMGDLLIPMGFSRQAAAEMSSETVNLSGALAEWSGGQYDAAQVSEILTKAMLGERDGLKALGISISQEEVNRKAAQVAQEQYGKNLEDLTDQELQQANALATQQLVMEKSTDAQNAYAEGAAGLTRAQSELTAKMNEGKDFLATAMIPVMGGLLGAVNGLPGPLGEVALGFVGVGAQMAPMLGSIGQMAVGFRAAGLSMSSITGPIMSVVSGLGSMIASAAASTASMVAAAGRQVAAWVMLGAQSLLAAAKVAAAWLISIGPIALVIAAVVGLVVLIVKNWEEIAEFLTKTWEWIKATAEKVWGAIVDFFTQAWEGVKRLAETVFNGIKAYFEFVFNAYKTAIETVWNAIKWFLEGLWNGIKAVAEVIFNALKAFFERWLDGVKRIWNALRDFFVGLWGGIRDTASTIFNTIKDKIVGAFTSMKDKVVGVWDDLTGRIRGFVNNMIGFINRLISAWNNLDFTLPSRSFDWNGPLPGGDITVGGWTIGTPNLGLIPHLAEGGNILRSGAAVVGEEGPELLRLPRGARVEPLGQGGMHIENLTLEINGQFDFTNPSWKRRFVIDMRDALVQLETEDA